MKHDSGTKSHVTAATQAWLPTSRSIDWRAPVAAVALAAGLILQERLTDPRADASSFTLKAQMIAALTAVAVSSILDDPAEALLDPSPTARGWRTSIRLSMVLLAWSIAWGLTLALINTAPGSADASGLTRQAVVLLAVALGAAAVRGPGAAAAVVALVAAASVLLPDRWSIATDGSGPTWRLAMLGTIGSLVLCWAMLDHARRHRSTRSAGPQRRNT